MLTRKPVGAEARGKWRQFRRDLMARRERIDDAVTKNRLRPLITAYLRPGCVGRDRLARRMTKALGGGARLESQTRNYLLWSYLYARDRVTITDSPNDPGLSQDAVAVNYLIIGQLPDSGRGMYHTADGLWTLEVADHAGGRLLERNPRANPADLIYRAHSDLLQVSTASLMPHLADRSMTFLLPAGDGWLACRMQHGHDVSANREIDLHARARSWLNADMAVDSQAIVGPGAVGEQIGQSYLLPAPLRRIVSNPLPDGRAELRVMTWQ